MTMLATMHLDLLPTRRAAIVAAAAALALALPRAAAAQDHHGHGDARHALLRIPEPMRVEHAEIHERLVAATKAPGRVGEAARALAAVLHPHFVREEQIALPPLGLLAPLARGEATPEMRAVLPMTDSLRAELPRMLKEHEAIHAATARLGEVARAEGHAGAASLADALALHAGSEEEIFYPAALLVGELVRAQTSRVGER